MPARKQKLGKPRFHLKFWFVFTIVALISVFSWSLYRRLVQPSGINLISNNEGFVYYEENFPKPTNSCYYQEVKCFTTPCEPILVCPSGRPLPSITPAPTPTPTLTPTATAVPLPTATAAPQTNAVASFTATKPCGTGGFLSIKFSCRDGRVKDLASDTCTNLSTAMFTAQSTCNNTTESISK